MVDSASESLIELNGGIAGFVSFTKPLVDALGAPIDGAKPFDFAALLRYVTAATYDASTEAVIGFADAADLSGEYVGGGVRWHSLAGQTRPYTEESAGNQVGTNSSAPVAVCVSIPRSAADKQAGWQANTINATDQQVQSTLKFAYPAIVPTHLYIAFRRTGIAGDTFVGMKYGVNIAPNREWTIAD